MPAFRILSDQALRAMATQRPETARELLAIPGIAISSVEKYAGQQFVIARENSHSSCHHRSGKPTLPIAAGTSTIRRIYCQVDVSEVARVLPVHVASTPPLRCERYNASNPCIQPRLPFRRVVDE